MPVVVDLEPLRKLARDIQACYPAVRTAVGIANAVAPELGARVRELDENLPHVVAGVAQEAQDQIKDEIRAVAMSGARALGRFIDDALVKSGHRAPRAQRLPKNKARAGRHGGA